MGASVVVTSTNVILSFQCDDRSGIVAAVTSLFAANDYNIVESSQFQDPHSNRFFMRTEYECGKEKAEPNEIREAFEPLATNYGMQWELVPKEQKTVVFAR